MSGYKEIKIWFGDDAELLENLTKLMLDLGACADTVSCGEYIVVYASGHMTWDTGRAKFDAHENKEVNIDWLRAKVVETEQSPKDLALQQITDAEKVIEEAKAVIEEIDKHKRVRVYIKESDWEAPSEFEEDKKRMEGKVRTAKALAGKGSPTIYVFQEGGSGGYWMFLGSEYVVVEGSLEDLKNK